MFYGFLNRTLGDFVKFYPVYRLAIEHALVFQDLVQVPGNGLTFAIRVSREIQSVCFLHCLDDGVNVTLVLLDQVILHSEVIVGIDSALFRNQITYMAI